MNAVAHAVDLRRRTRVVLSQPLLMSVFLATALFTAGAIHISGFTARYSIMSMLTLAALLGIASCGQTLVVVLGGIDLSIPFVIDFADVVAGELNGRGWPFLGHVPARVRDCGSVRCAERDRCECLERSSAHRHPR